ncbi:Conserved_hypothetical protein [Hexamita inflata]|uniref:Transmembrane protein n=1 Tax=Hexamita inflata TaxID=28002 RepID=A0AA86PH03_9EUKA|nr:Conserved hypothetical protein [Hexamita inflata]
MLLLAHILTEHKLDPGNVTINEQFPFVTPIFPTVAPTDFQCYTVYFKNNTEKVIYFKLGMPSYYVDGFVVAINRTDTPDEKCDFNYSYNQFPVLNWDHFAESYIFMGHSVDFELYNSSTLYQCNMTKTDNATLSDTNFSVEFNYGPYGFKYDTALTRPFKYIQRDSCITYKFIDFNFSNDNTVITPGAYRFLNPIEKKGMPSNYSQLCMGDNSDECTNFTVPFTMNVTKNISVFQHRSIVHGRNNSYQNLEFTIDESDDPAELQVIKNKCIKFIAASARNLTFYKPDPTNSTNPLIETFTIAAQHMLTNSPSSKVASGYVCVDELRFYPLTLLTAKDKQTKSACSHEKTAPEYQPLYNFMKMTCADLVFLGAYTQLIVILFIILCIIFQVTWIWQKKDWFNKKRLIIKLVTISLATISLILNCVAYSTGVAATVIVPVALWVYQLFVEVIGATSYETESIGKNMFKYLFQCNSGAGLSLVANLLAMWLITLLLSIFSAVLSIADICQFLGFLKIDLSVIDQSIFMLPSNWLTNVSQDMLHLFPGAVYIMPAILMVILISLQTFGRSRYFRKQVDRMRVKRIAENKRKKQLKLAKEQGLKPDAIKLKEAKSEKLTLESYDDDDEEEEGGADWKGFGIKVAFTFMTYFYNFMQLTNGEMLMVIFYSEQDGPTGSEVFIMTILGAYLFVLCKFNVFIQLLSGFYFLLLQILVNFCIIFVRAAQSFTNIIIFIITAPVYFIIDDSGMSFLQFMILVPVTLITTVFEVLFSVLETANYVLYPLYLLMAEFMPNFDFLMFVFGVIQPQEKLAENGRQMMTEGAVDSVLRVLTACCAYMFLGIFTITQQDLEVFKDSLVYMLIFLLIPTMRYQYDFEQFMNKIVNIKLGQPGLKSNIYSNISQVFNSLVEMLVEFKYKNNCHKHLEDLNAEYDTEEDYFGNCLTNMLFNGYGFIPVIGPVVGVFTSFMNDPSLSEGGETTLQVSYFLNWLHFIAILVAVLVNVYIPNNTYLIFIGFYFFLAALDAFDSTSELIPEASRLGLLQLFPCIGKYFRNKKQTDDKISMKGKATFVNEQKPMKQSDKNANDSGLILTTQMQDSQASQIIQTGRKSAPRPSLKLNSLNSNNNSVLKGDSRPNSRPASKHLSRPLSSQLKGKKDDDDEEWM